MAATSADLLLIVVAYLTANTFLLARLLGDFADVSNFAAMEVIAAVKKPALEDSDYQSLVRANDLLIPSMRDALARCLPGFVAVFGVLAWLVAYVLDLALPANLGFWGVTLLTIGFFGDYLRREYALLRSTMGRARNLEAQVKDAVTKGRPHESPRQ